MTVERQVIGDRAQVAERGTKEYSETGRAALLDPIVSYRYLNRKKHHRKRLGLVPFIALSGVNGKMVTPFLPVAKC